MRLQVLHGPNLNLLGTREPEVYGTATLADVDERIRAVAAELDAEVEIVQSNHEGALIDAVQQAAGATDGFVVNAGGYTHTSVALRDALVASGRPFVEVHVSNVFGREAFRRESLLADVAAGTVSGFGADSYTLAVRGLVRHLMEMNRE
ncbi:MAG: type II 3-dehydroquinate dehydratase [Candidatus Longimicrobiales bacterium M2_2A_002]